jgi:hypothetical protein
MRFVTLTQRAVVGAPLQLELDRLLGSWARMTRGRPGDLFRLLFVGTWRGMEVTRGAPSGHPSLEPIADGATTIPGSGLWWHAHAHVLMDVRPVADRAAEAERRAAIQDGKAADAWYLYWEHPLALVEGVGAWRDPAWKARALRHEARARYWRKLGREAVAVGPEPDRWLGARWRDASLKQARAAFPRRTGERRADWIKRSDRGWDPHAGMQRKEDEDPGGWIPLGRDDDGQPCGPYAEPKRSTSERRIAGDWSGPWYKRIDGDEAERRRSVYQAAKYPTPMCKLNPVQLAEFVSVAYMRRWHQGAGRFRGIMARADRIHAQLVDTGALGQQDPGAPLASMAPGKCPALDDLDRVAGWDKPPKLDPANQAPGDQPISWKLAESAVERIPGLSALLEQVGCFAEHDGEGGWFVEAPRGLLRAGLRDYLAGIKPPDPPLEAARSSAASCS